MEGTPAVSLIEHFAKLKDPRIDRTKHHNLIDIVVIAICAVIGGEVARIHGRMSNCSASQRRSGSASC